MNKKIAFCVFALPLLVAGGILYAVKIGVMQEWNSLIFLGIWIVLGGIIMMLSSPSTTSGLSGLLDIFPEDWSDFYDYWAVICWGLFVLGVALILPEIFNSWWEDKALFFGSQIPPVALGVMWGKGKGNTGKFVMSLLAIILAVVAIAKVAEKSGYDFSHGISGLANRCDGIVISADAGWVDTGIIADSQYINFSSTGKVNASENPKDGANKWVDQDGWNYRPSFLKGRHLLVDSASFMALVGKIGTRKFAINQQTLIQPDMLGKRIYASANDVPGTFGDNKGSHCLRVKRVEVRES